MRKAIRCACLIFLLLVPLTGCKGISESSVDRLKNQYDAECYDLFDTYCRFTFYNDQATDKNDQLFESLHQELLSFHQQTDIYQSYEGMVNLKDLNDAAGNGQALCISKELFDFLVFCKDAYQASQETVNVMLGSVTGLWEKTRETAVLPSKEALFEAAQHTDLSLLVLDEVTCSAKITDPKASIDVGALAKGYAGDLAKAFLLEHGQTNFLLNMGGNILTEGAPLSSGRDHFIIGIQDPDKPTGDYLQTISLVGGECAVTSGDYQRYVMIDGVRYHHILDPATLYPADKHRSVTVVCQSSKDADMLSTALFVLDENQGKALAQQYGAEVYYH